MSLTENEVRYQCAALADENARLRAALKEVDRLAVNHTKGGLGLAQKIARAAIIDIGSTSEKT